MSQAELVQEPIGTVELRIPSKAEWVAVARLAIAAVANRLPFSVEEIEDLKLAIAEACTMCIQHASANDSIDIVCETGSSYVRLDVRDHRYGLAEAAGTPLPAPLSNSGEGLGVFLIQALMDELAYHIDDTMGTALVMTKRVGA